MIATVEYHICSYRGTVQVSCSEDEDDEQIYARAERKAAQGAHFPIGYRGFKILSRD